MLLYVQEVLTHFILSYQIKWLKSSMIDSNSFRSTLFNDNFEPMQIRFHFLNTVTSEMIQSLQKSIIEAKQF